MELLLIKAGRDYIRVKGESYQRCGLDKASVYPVEKLANVRSHAAALSRQGIEAVNICKLILTEVPFEMTAEPPAKNTAGLIAV